MSHFLSKKLKSLTETQVTVLTIILVCVNIGIVLFWIHFWVSSPKTAPSPVTKESPQEISELLKPGDIGEIKVKEETGQEVPLVTPTLPLTIFSTTGAILEVKNDRLIVKGDGFSFADQKPRELTVVFTDLTITFREDRKTKYEGLTGLKYLKSGMEILIRGEGNIRGKIEFKAKTINIL